MGREINCPDCESTISITTDEEGQIFVKPKEFATSIPFTTESQIRIAPQPSMAKTLLVKMATLGLWGVIVVVGGLLLVGLFSDSPSQTVPPPPENPVVKKTPPPAELEPPEWVPETEEPGFDSSPLVVEKKPQEETKPLLEEPQPPASNWKFSGLPAVKAERPAPAAPVYPAKWVQLMTLPILEYRVEAIPLPAILSELEQLAGTDFQSVDESTNQLLSDENVEVSFVLQSTDFAEILTTTLATANLEFKLTETELVIQPQTTSPAP